MRILFHAANPRLSLNPLRDPWLVTFFLFGRGAASQRSTQIKPHGSDLLGSADSFCALRYENSDPRA
jgi:hypothetical protein